MTRSDPIAEPSNLLRFTPSTPRSNLQNAVVSGKRYDVENRVTSNENGKGTGTARRGDNGSRDSKRRCYSNAHETHDFALIYPAPAVPICFG
jgi:hypothetical protein